MPEMTVRTQGATVSIDCSHCGVTDARENMSTVKAIALHATEFH